jgi:hypothetical protein
VGWNSFGDTIEAPHVGIHPASSSGLYHENV